jgi:AraC family transcriptional regulator of adaptative response/methylated-DNA-[protein]-cysteine methyltransferase
MMSKREQQNVSALNENSNNSAPSCAARLTRATIEKLCRHIEAHADEILTLKVLSEIAQASPFHVQRIFKAMVGLTPRQYQEACRMKTLRRELRNGTSATAAIYEAGFGSGSRVYGRIDTHMGMTPKQYRSGGQGVEISYAVADTPLGKLMMGATDRGLCFVQFGGNEKALLKLLEQEFPGAAISAMPVQKGDFRRWMTALSKFLAGDRQRLDLPADVRGTAFQMKVWRYLQHIPYGETQTYAEVARGIGAPRAARAVGSACAANRLALVIPCHRVIRGDGEPGGYRWGLARKRKLLEQEHAVLTK